MNIKKSKGSYKLIILIVILIIIVVGLIYYKTLSNDKTGKDSFTNYSDYSKKYILEDCMDGWGKEYVKKNPSDTRSINDICMSNAYLSDPKLLCGICGTNDSPIFSMTSTLNSNKKYYGCSANTDNSISLNWGDQGTVINKLLSDRMTCDTFSINAKGGMYIYMAGDDVCTISLNDKVVYTYNWGQNVVEYYIENVGYGDKLSFSCKNTGGPGGLCFSYIWNKQLFILENNGYQNCANTIYYTTEGKNKWDNLWSNIIPGLLPWMKNWITCADGNNTNISITTYVGSTKNVELMNNDCVIFGSLTHKDNSSYISQDSPDAYAVVWSNSSNKSSKILLFDSNYKKNFENKYYEYKIDNVMEGDIFFVGGNSKLSKENQVNSLDITVSYIWCGRIFSTPRDDNFNKITEQIYLQSLINKTSTDNGDFKYELISRLIENNNFPYYTKMKLRTEDNINSNIYYFTINNIRLNKTEVISNVTKFQSDISNIKF